MANLIERLADNLSEAEADQHIAAHHFYSWVCALVDGQITRTQLENHFNIATTGQDKAQLDGIANGFNAAVDKGRYLNAIHSAFMVTESGQALTTQQIQQWLTDAQAGY